MNIRVRYYSYLLVYIIENTGGRHDVFFKAFSFQTLGSASCLDLASR